MDVKVTDLIPHFKNLIKEGQEIEAMRDYRKITRSELKEAREFIYNLKKEIRIDDLEKRISELEDKVQHVDGKHISTTPELL